MAHDDFTCPACGADFEVRERLDDETQGDAGGTTEDTRDDTAETVSCPNCGAAVPTQ